MELDEIYSNEKTYALVPILQRTLCVKWECKVVFEGKVTVNIDVKHLAWSRRAVYLEYFVNSL